MDRADSLSGFAGDESSTIGATWPRKRERPNPTANSRQNALTVVKVRITGGSVYEASARRCRTERDLRTTNTARTATTIQTIAEAP